MTRSLIAVVVAIVAGAVAAWMAMRAADLPAYEPRLTWVATARQFGPVSYRDPAGAISPDGKWIAYSEGRFLRVRPVGGGPSVEFPPGDAQIRNLAWSPDSRSIVADGRSRPGDWSIYDRIAATSSPLTLPPNYGALVRQLTWSPDGQALVGVAYGSHASELVTVSTDGTQRDSKVISSTTGGFAGGPRVSFPAWTPRRELACIATIDGRERVTIPCGGAALDAQPDADAYGPLAFSPDGAQVYVSLANRSGTVDLWSLSTDGRHAKRLTLFDRDSYAPSVAADGTVLVRVQSYRTVVAVAPASGGGSQPLASFQSETPSWDPSGRWIGITFGTWRRVPDDAKYPDIAQDAGIIGADPAQPAAKPASIVHDSASEDQSLCWSPNGQWIAFHSHKEQSDDIWLRRATGDPTARRLTMLGRGTEAGWPRWSRDGRWLLFTGASRQTRRSVVFVVGINQESGEATSEVREIPIGDLPADLLPSEWLDPGERIGPNGKVGPGRHVIFTVARDGGSARVVHRVASEHDFPGLGVSPDGTAVAFIAPAADGFFQVHRLSIDGGAPVQVTTDPSNKTQPAWSPDGRRIAFTVWSYESQFWRLDPR